MKWSDLTGLVRTASALRFRCRLQPAGGPGDVVYPPTYGDGSTRHERMIDGERVPCVLLDSVASQANRIELALLDAVRDNGVELPFLEVNVDDYTVTSFEAPHRFCDAIFRGCRYNGAAFLESELGKALLNRDSSELFGYCPTALLFGMWHSNRKGAEGMRLPRCIVSEVVAVDVSDSPHAKSRVDPLPISKGSKVSEHAGAWRMDTNGKRPSEQLLGNIPPEVEDGRGITMQYAEQSCVISLPALRQLRLGDVAHTALAALGIAGFTLAFGNGCWYRSRCHLTPETVPAWKAVTGAEIKEIGPLNRDDALTLLQQAVEQIKVAELPWHGRIELEPSDDLVQLVTEGKAALGTGAQK